MFKPWLINEKYRGTDHETIVKLHFMNPVEQDRIAGDSILLTTKAFPYFFKLIMNDIAALPVDAPYRQVNMLIKRDVENAILKTINNSPELKKAWKLPTQDSLFSFGYRMRRLYITGKKSIDELKFDTVVPPVYSTSTIMIEPRNVLIDETNPSKIHIRALGETYTDHEYILPAQWNMDNLRLVRKIDRNSYSAISYELRCRQFISDKALITAPGLVEQLKAANYDGTYTGGR